VIVEEFRVSALAGLLNVMEAEIGCLARNIVLHGISDESLSRYDALCRISETCFDELEGESTAESTSVSDLAARLGYFNLALEGLVEEHAELDEGLSRSSKIREGSDLLRENILGSCGFSRARAIRKDATWRPASKSQSAEISDWETEEDIDSGLPASEPALSLTMKLDAAEGVGEVAFPTHDSEEDDVVFIRPTGNFRTIKRRTD
jgi:hypothetical protein